jgi:hypothetical protein
MVEENLSLQMVVFMMVNGKITYPKDKDSILAEILFGDIKGIG